MTREGLEDQLLAAVVARERPDLEALKVRGLEGLVRGVEEAGALRRAWAGSMRAPLRVPAALCREPRKSDRPCSCWSPAALQPALPGHAHHLSLWMMLGPSTGHICLPSHQHVGGPMTEVLVPALCCDLLSDTLGAAVAGKPYQEPERVQDQAEGAGRLPARPAVGCRWRLPAGHCTGGEPGDNEAHSQGN